MSFSPNSKLPGWDRKDEGSGSGEQRPALICGDLALTSTRSLDGNITTEVARRQDDGTWLWAIDRWGDQEPGNSK